MLGEDILDTIARQRLAMLIYEYMAAIPACRHAAQPVQGIGGLTP
jgi:hypothetical protein